MPNTFLLKGFLAELSACFFFLTVTAFACIACKDIPLAIAIANGFTEIFCLHQFGFIAGSHLNPVVTAISFAQGLIPCNLMMVQFPAQLIGHLLGYSFIGIIYPEMIDAAHEAMKSHPMLSMGQAFIAELICSTLFCLCWCAVWDRRARDIQSSAGLRLGSAMAGLTLLAMKITGAGFNIFRSLAISICHNDYEFFWSFASAHVAGAALAYLIWNSLLTPMCRQLYRCRPRNGLTLGHINRWVELVSKPK